MLLTKQLRVPKIVPTTNAYVNQRQRFLDFLRRENDHALVKRINASEPRQVAHDGPDLRGGPRHIQVDPQMPTIESHRLGHAVADALRREIVGVQDVLVHVEPAS